MWRKKKKKSACLNLAGKGPEHLIPTFLLAAYFLVNVDRLKEHEFDEESSAVN